MTTTTDSTSTEAFDDYNSLDGFEAVTEAWDGDGVDDLGNKKKNKPTYPNGNYKPVDGDDYYDSGYNKSGVTT